MALNKKQGKPRGVAIPAGLDRYLRPPIKNLYEWEGVRTVTVGKQPAAEANKKNPSGK
jgi:hypothetical protein